jgi:DNA invertase Pin-like site-specific DNA recombinase
MAYRVDRLSRNIVKFLSFLEDLNDRNISVFAQDENLWYNEKKLEFIQCIVDANKEAVLIGKRVRLSLEHRRERGDEIFGGVPYGFQIKRGKNKKILKVINQAETNIINKIKQELGKDKSFKEIADFLNKQGLRKRGKKWKASLVKNIVM